MAQDLDAAYGLETPDDNLRLYRDWAARYDSDFAKGMHYELPLHVAKAYHAAGGGGAVIDLGAGTGLCGVALSGLVHDPIDACDLSGEMLAVAREKQVYRKLFTGNLLDRLPIEDGAYAGAVSAGTFTHGHVGPSALAEVLRVVQPGGPVVIAVNAEHWHAEDYAQAVDALDVTEMGWREVRIYGVGASGEHADDKSRILLLRKR